MKSKFSVFLFVFLIVSLVLTAYIPELKAQDDPTFGYESKGESVTQLASYVYKCLFDLTEDGTVTHLNIYVHNTAAVLKTNAIDVGLYDGEAKQVNKTIDVPASNDAFLEVDITDTPLFAGTYGLAFKQRDSSIICYYTTGTTDQSQYKGGFSADDFLPDTFDNPANVDRKYSIFANYTAAEGETKYFYGSVTQQYGVNYNSAWTFNRYLTANPQFTINHEKTVSFNRYAQINPIFSINHLNNWQFNLYSQINPQFSINHLNAWSFNLFSTINPIFQINHRHAWTFNLYPTVTQTFTIESTAKFISGTFLNLYGSIIQQWTINLKRLTTFHIYATVNPVFSIWGGTNLAITPSVEVSTFGTIAFVLAIVALAIGVTALMKKSA